MVSIAESKRCTKCGEWKPVEAFGRHRAYLDGRLSFCKACRKAPPVLPPGTRRCRTCGEVKPEAAFVRMSRLLTGRLNRCLVCHRRTCRLSNAKHREQRAQRRRAFAAANPDYDRQYRRAHPDATAAAKAKWRRANPASVRAAAERRRGRVRGASGSFTLAEWEALCASYGGRCLACGALGALTIDHVVPLALGGSNDIGNLQPLCASHNQSKGARILDYRPSATGGGT